MMLRGLIVATTFLLLSGCAEFSPFKQYSYLAEDSIAPELLGKPLQEKSAAWKQNIQAVINAQKHYTASELEQARYEHTQLNSDIFVAVANPKLNRGNAPETFRMLDQAKEDCMDMVGAVKQYWVAPRPYLTDARIKPLVKNPSTNSTFPSGHTACSKVVADILGDLYPHRRAALAERAKKSGYYRMILGLHYPHDLAAGRTLATRFYQQLKQSEPFIQDLASAKSELSIAE